VVELFTGPERAIASTKTFTSSCHALAQFVSALSGSSLDGLDAVPDIIERTAEWALTNALPTSLLNAAGGLTVVGRGIGYASAAEISLKIREVTGIRSEAYSAPDYLHGPIGADGQGATLLVVVTDEMEDEIAASLIDSARSAVCELLCCALSNTRHRRVTPTSWCPNRWIIGALVWRWWWSDRFCRCVWANFATSIDTSPGLNKVTLTA